MKKRISAVLAVMLLVFLVTACGSGDSKDGKGENILELLRP